MGTHCGLSFPEGEESQIALAFWRPLSRVTSAMGSHLGPAPSPGSLPVLPWRPGWAEAGTVVPGPASHLLLTCHSSYWPAPLVHLLSNGCHISLSGLQALPLPKLLMVTYIVIGISPFSWRTSSRSYSLLCYVQTLSPGFQNSTRKGTTGLWLHLLFIHRTSHGSSVNWNSLSFPPNQLVFPTTWLSFVSLLGCLFCQQTL